MARSSTAFVVSLMLVVGCAGDPSTQYTPEAITSAERGGTLDSLYDQVSSEVDDARAGSTQANRLTATRDEIGKLLASDRSTEIRATLDEGSLPSGLTPISILDEARSALAPIERWNSATFQDLDQEISKKRSETEAAIEVATGELDSLAPDRVPERLQALKELGEFAGPTSEAAQLYEAERKDALSNLNDDAARAMQVEDYEEARRVLEQLRQVDPSDESIAGQLVQADIKLFEAQFWQALEDGKPGEAYGRFTALSEEPQFDQIRPRLEKSADTMARFFVTLAVSASEADELENAYRWFAQARDIGRRLGTDYTLKEGEDRGFLDKIHERFETAKGKDLYGLALGYMGIIAEFDSQYPDSRRDLRSTREVVLNRAVKRLAASAFSDGDDDAADFGEAVASKVVQYLFERIPNDVRIIERQQLEDILREKEIGSPRKKGDSQLISADYLVQGTILEAKVDSTEKSGRKTLRVVTEEEEVPNPRYASWRSLGEMERELVAVPPETMIVAKKEDVTIQLTYHRKVGLFSASYRIIDAQSAKIVFADSVRAKKEHSDISSEGIELGEFKREFKIASLPSDIEILAELADEVSEDIGDHISEVLVDPEVKYEESARRFAQEGNFVEASQNFAYALVLAERKDKDVASLRTELHEHVMMADLSRY